MFDDRNDAARQLAERLRGLRGRNPLVIAIPRGAVPMARVIADALDGELDVALVRKLGAPGNPEMAIGAVDETGAAYLAPSLALTGADTAYVDAECARQRATLRARREQYAAVHRAIDPAHRVVVVVDDGLATGATMIAALRGLRARGPATLICAVPVASAPALAAVRPEADDVVCLIVPRDFHAVGEWYRSFPQVDDAEVLRLLSGGAVRHEPAQRPAPRVRSSS